LVEHAKRLKKLGCRGALALLSLPQEEGKRLTSLKDSEGLQLPRLNGKGSNQGIKLSVTATLPPPIPSEREKQISTARNGRGFMDLPRTLVGPQSS
jgi:hypothetical protein